MQDEENQEDQEGSQEESNGGEVCTSKTDGDNASMDMTTLMDMMVVVIIYDDCDEYDECWRLVLLVLVMPM